MIPSRLTSIDKCHVVKDLGLRREGNHPRLVVGEAVVDPNQRRFPIKFTRQGQRDAMLGSIRHVFGAIELDSHELM